VPVKGERIRSGQFTEFLDSCVDPRPSIHVMVLEKWAQSYATMLLGQDERRLTHTKAVAQKAKELGEELIDDPFERDVLVAAAWLHDIGYASTLATTGAHHLDGATHLEARGEVRLAVLVAHHGSGQSEVTLRGYGEDIARFPREESLVDDLLTYCDLTSGPDGANLTLVERLKEVRARYGDDDIVVRGLGASRDRIDASFKRVETAIASAT
jgi:HD superfamily phosphodiesterase